VEKTFFAVVCTVVSLDRRNEMGALEKKKTGSRGKKEIEILRKDSD